MLAEVRVEGKTDNNVGCFVLEISHKERQPSGGTQRKVSEGKETWEATGSLIYSYGFLIRLGVEIGSVFTCL